MVRAELFYYLPVPVWADRDLPVPFKNAASATYVLASPRPYGLTLDYFLELVYMLRAKLRDAGINFADGGFEDAEFETGPTDWDQLGLRIRLWIHMKLEPEEARIALKKTGFVEILQAGEEET